MTALLADGLPSASGTALADGLNLTQPDILADGAKGVIGVVPGLIVNDVPTHLGMFLSEFTGTAILVLLGCGVVVGNLLPANKNRGGGWLMVAFGWGLGVYAGVYAAWATGGHLNPAVTIAKWVSHEDLAPNIPGTFGNVVIFIVAQMVGAFVGAILVWLAHKKQFDQEAPAGDKLGVFSTGPEIRSYGWNLLTEIIATFVLVSFVTWEGQTPTKVGPLGVALIVLAIGISLGGPTGYAINPARDLGPRIAHAILPIPGKGSSDWSYSWVPVVGPIIGGVLAAFVGPLLIALPS